MKVYFLVMNSKRCKKSNSMAKEMADNFSEAATQTERVTVVLGLC